MECWSIGVLEYRASGSPKKTVQFVQSQPDPPQGFGRTRQSLVARADPSFGGASAARFNRYAPFKRFDRLERLELFELNRTPSLQYSSLWAD